MTPRPPFALLAHRLSSEFQARFEGALGTTPVYVDLGAIGRLSRFEGLRQLRAFAGAPCFLPVEHDEDGPLLPLLRTAALVSGARSTEIVHADLRRLAARRREALGAAALLAAASIDGRLALRRCRQRLGELADRPRIAVLGTRVGRAFVLYSSFWSFHRAGAQFARLAGIANGLAEAGYDVAVASALPALPVDAQVELHGLRRPRAFATPYELNPYRLQRSVVRDVEQLAAGRPPALIYERASRGSYAGVELSRRLGAPLVLEYNFPSSLEAEDWGARLSDGALAGRVEAVCLRHAHVVLAITEELRDAAIERGADPERVVLHPSGADARLFDPARVPEAERATVRDRIGIAPDAVVVAFSGSFRDVHGVELIAEAAHRLAGESADRRIHFLLVGDGPRLGEIRERLGCLPFVTFTGLVPLERMPGLLAASDILVAPFHPGPVGLSPSKVFEYMAMGKPIVLSDADQLGELARPALEAHSLPEANPEPGREELALLVRTGVPDDLVRAIRFLADNPSWRSALGERARARLLERYTWRHQLEAVLTRLEELEPSR